jgi:hypothetical protein
LQLLDDGGKPSLAGAARVRRHALPAQQEAHEVLRRDWLDFAP